MKKGILIALFILSNSAFSQDMLSFQDCLDQVLKNNLDIKTAYNQDLIA